MARPRQGGQKKGPRNPDKPGTIYMITCLPTGEQYIGLTTKRNVRERWKEHLRAAKTQEDRITALYTRMRQFSRRDFKFEVLMTAPERELVEHERRLISEFNTQWPNGLNLTPGGESSIKRAVDGTASTAESDNQASDIPDREECPAGDSSGIHYRDSE